MYRGWDIEDTLREFLALKAISETARDALGVIIRQEMQRAPHSRETVSMREALEYLSEVREGFALTLRTERVRDPRELMYLVNRLIMDWGWLEDLGLQLALPETVERVGRQLIAFAMAAVALALAPQLPPEAVTFPVQTHFPRRTYADLPVPETPGDLWERIEEVERVVYAAGIRHLAAVHPSPLRRAYAFFEANAWIAERELSRYRGHKNH